MSIRETRNDRTSITVKSPVDGFCFPLEATPDEAMASGVLGSGVAIEPLSNRFYAPIEGTISSIARTRHAIAIRSQSGVEVLIHVGVDTVSLNGDGFDVEVAEGDHVEVGDLLLSIDDAVVAAGAKSLCTPVLALDADRSQITVHAPEGVVKAGAALFAVRPASKDGAGVVSDKQDKAAVSVRLQMAEGLHARPAAQVANQAKLFQGLIELVLNNNRANAKSVSSIMALGTNYADTIEIVAQGDDAAGAVEALANLINSGAGDPIRPFEERSAAADPSKQAKTSPDKLLTGAVASPGLAIGKIYHHVVNEIAIPASDGSPAETTQKLQSALDRASRLIRLRASEPGAGAEAKLLEAHAAIIEDPDLQSAAFDQVQKGSSAGASWAFAIDRQAGVFQDSRNPRLMERIPDLNDVKRKVLSELYECEDEAGIEDAEGAIVLAQDLTPSDFLALLQAGAKGFCLARSGTTSHVAILATSYSVPLLVAMGPHVLDVPQGAMSILDTAAGQLDINADEKTIQAIQVKAARRDSLLIEAQESAHLPSALMTGEAISIQTNLNTSVISNDAVLKHTDGCGLLRSEFLFADRHDPPSEQEQMEAYSAVIGRFSDREVTIRTMDIGGDKPVPFLPGQSEPNPALGLRGIRMSFAHPELMRWQVRAILRASQAGKARMMAPMVSDAAEMRRFKSFVQRQAAELGISDVLPVGTMIETPSSAVLADQIACEADFFSIGTNDLAQYVLAMDRTHPDLARELDALHPSVLRLIGSVSTAGKAQGIETSVCGGLASDPLGVPILIGLGIKKLSVVEAMIAPVNSIIRKLDIEACEITAQDALNDQSAADVRMRVRRAWPFLDDWT